MIGRMPNFFKSPNYVDEPTPRLKPAATDEEKQEFEEYMNMPYSVEQYKRENPSIKNPYYTWEGKIIEQKRSDGAAGGDPNWEDFDEDANTEKMIAIEKKMNDREISSIEALCTDEVMDDLPAGFFDGDIKKIQQKFPEVVITENVKNYCALFLKYNKFIQGIEGEFDD